MLSCTYIIAVAVVVGMARENKVGRSIDFVIVTLKS